MDIAKRFPQLSETVLRNMINDICSMLPAPEPDTPENRERFRQAAINEFINLDPFDIFDAMAARSIIISEALAWECSRNARIPGDDLKLVGGWYAVADNHRRLAQSMRGDIEKRRKKRLKEVQKLAAKAKRERRPVALTLSGPSFRAPPQRQPTPREQRAERIRTLGLRLVEAPPALH